jgi:ATP-dependent Clp protease ATP-binding subunit ClpB
LRSFWRPKRVYKVDCAEFQHSHEIAKLIGSPPGYIGHRETKPILAQEFIDKFQTETLKLNFLLFDGLVFSKDEYRGKLDSEPQPS